ncbi:MAG: hypothetical protein AAFV95_14250 [Bacteroidota bacterium]
MTHQKGSFSRFSSIALTATQSSSIKGGNNNQPVATVNGSTIDADEETR